MKIRSITCFLNPGWPLDGKCLDAAGKLAAVIRLRLEAAEYEVQTVRLATVPFPYLLAAGDEKQLPDLAVALETAAAERGFTYVSLGHAQPDRPDSYPVVADAIAATQNAFFSGLMTTSGGGVSLPAVRRCAEIIHKVAPLSPDGFANLRFAALANVPANGPFFPSAYARQDSLVVSIATEAADLAVEIFNEAASLEAARQRLIAVMEDHASVITQIVDDVARAQDAQFGGLDFTLASFPEENDSLATALERLGLPAVGQPGSLAAAAFLADTLDRVRYPRAGFNGLMMPVLEDFTLARRGADGWLSIKDLLMFSAVCGTGLDTLPLPGSVSEEVLYALLLDVAFLAQRLGKPLTARLMPVPGKNAGDPTGFDFEFFQNSRVFPLPGSPLRGPLAGEETVQLQPRIPHTENES